MLRRFFPKLYVTSVYNVPYKKLLEKNITALIFDIDNTLVPHDVEKPTQEVINLFAKLQTMGFKICLLSNNKESRVAAFNIHLKLPAVSMARKPTSKGVKRALLLLDATVNNAAIIGDQVFTDVWCGNRLNVFTVLVKPISTRDEFTVKLKRGIEKIIVNIYVKQRKLQLEDFND